MFNEERQTLILELIESEGRVEVNQLSETLKVSLDTIRRDLRKMEQEGLLKRTHGGAVSIKPVGVAMDFTSRKRLHSEEKSAIALKACQIIKDYDSLIFDGSTTTLAMIPHLIKFNNLNIFTNSIEFAYEVLRLKKNFKVNMMGGVLHNEHGTAISGDTVKYIEKLNVDKVFIGSCSVSLERGLSTSDVEDAMIKQAMIGAGRQVYILADHSKFTRESLISIEDLSEKFTLISDSLLKKNHESIYRQLIDRSIEVII